MSRRRAGDGRARQAARAGAAAQGRIPRLTSRLDISRHEAKLPRINSGLLVSLA